MAADSSMGFHQGITTSLYNHHMLSFQSSSNVGIGGGGGGMTTAPRSVSGASSNAGMYLSPNTGVISNSSGVGPSRSSSGDVGYASGAPKYKFVTGSPADWSDQELSILKEGLVRYAREPNIMKYIKIAAMLPNRTIRDVALRCWWNTGKDKRKKPDGVYSGKKVRDIKPMQEKLVTSPMANFHMTHANNVTPFSISMQQSNQQCQVPKEAAPVVDSATQLLLEENNQLLNQIAANIETLKAEDNTNLFLRTSSNIKTILCRMNETPGIMGRMPPLPVAVNEDQLNSLLQLNRMVASYGTSYHTKQEPRS